ncbi:MAG: glycosyltransferase family 4 protein [Proteobacteria bacterium]|nr:glycosyltransferase family 4 protein [Pseudomonadota bacterium]
MRVLFLTRYARLAASSRLRVYQYLPYLMESGFEVTVVPLFGNDYVSGLYSGNISTVAVFKAYIDRLRFILKVRYFDLVWVEYEMLPWLPDWIELSLLPGGAPLVVDYDDAIFNRYDQHRLALVRRVLGKKIDVVMCRAALVIVGNDYLGAHARQAGAKRVELLPTVVDGTRYAVIEKNDALPVTIGWIGSPTTAQYLKLVAPALRTMIASYNARLVAIGANPSQLQDLTIEIRRWSEDTEAAEIQQFDIGIMPLPDNLWERGKCGYKLIQYMASGKPVVASPVGVNNVIVRRGVNGFLANTDSEWYNSLRLLCEDAALRKRMGDAGRSRMERDYSLQVAAPRLAELLRSVVNK